MDVIREKPSGSGGELYADIIVNIVHEALDKSFQYRVPEALRDAISPGDYVRIPFGKGNRLIEGYVISFGDKPLIDPSKIKDIDSVIRDSALVEGKLIKLAAWMKERYGSTMIQALKTVLPIKKDTKIREEKTVILKLSETETEAFLDECVKKHRTARERLIRALSENGEIDKRLITEKLNISAATLKALEEQDIIEVRSVRSYRNVKPAVSEKKKIILNSEQRETADAIIKDIRQKRNDHFLIHGITGSGKTEVYMEIIESVIKEGNQVIMLIPEIALTFQTLMRFYNRFGDRVSTLHSKLSQGERYDQFERAKKGEISVMIGPRSALFTPFSKLGLIVIDEEHEPSYKSDSMPKYQAREVAYELARLHGAGVVMGSATPSVDSYYDALKGKSRLFTLKNRAVENATLADVSIIDLKEELKAGNRSVFSRSLKSGIEDCLNKNEQVMLFLNRRGFAGFVSCRACGHVIKCPHCDVSLSLHKNGRLLCHYCGYETANVTACPNCRSTMIGAMRAGTEQIEAMVKKTWPYASVLRMDADTTKKKDDYDRILSSFANREADILIGTQMIVKGHDFPYVTLVGVLAADMSLFANDYRASERTFELLTQAAGRAGRADRKGKVIIQTYNPDHYSITASAAQDYEAFYEQEIAYRQFMDYPPAGHMLAVLLESEDESTCDRILEGLAAHIKNAIITDENPGKARMNGPVDCNVKKIKDVYRKIIYIKSRDEKLLIRAKDEAEAYMERTQQRGVHISFDLDPLHGY
ncbi:MAG: primosomal protein N' [Lachnospiraceae bacterium]|nr:primosomal protein N' [Lachnospiraceae bacterium]